jgi:CheY-like chemotaxis protein
MIPMKKILMVKDILSFIGTERNIFNRAFFKIFTAPSNEKALEIHQAENVDLIITKLILPGMSGDQLCSLIRKDPARNHVSVIIVCDNNPPDIERSMTCNANSVITLPSSPVILFEKAIHLLNIPKRESYRVLLSIKVQGKYADTSFYCTSVNISVTGMLIETDRPFAQGDILSCSFFLPDTKQIQVNGKVVRVIQKVSGRNEYGVHFVDLTPDNRSAIEAYITRKSGDK